MASPTVELDKYWWHGFEISGAPAVLGFVVHDVGTRDGPWGRRRLQDYMTPMLRASETSWHARMPREYARRIAVAIVQRKNFDPRRWIGDGDEDQWAKFTGCGKGGWGWIIRIPLSSVRGGEFRSYPFWSFENRSLWNEWNEINTLIFFFFFVFRVNICCVFGWW